MFDKISMSWVDRQVRYDTPEAAKKAAPASRKWRIMVVEGKKRYPLVDKIAGVV